MPCAARLAIGSADARLSRNPGPCSPFAQHAPHYYYRSACSTDGLQAIGSGRTTALEAVADGASNQRASRIAGHHADTARIDLVRRVAFRDGIVRCSGRTRMQTDRGDEAEQLPAASERPSQEQMKRPRVVVVTGATAGVGRATVRAFAKAGADIALLARNEAALDAARREVESAGQRALVFPLDVADAGAVAAAAAETEAQLGPIDVWVNNAMATVVSPVAELRPDEVRRVTEVTYLGTVHGTLAALQYMLPRNRGSIMQVGSALAYRAIPLQAPYCGAKFAVRGFTDSLRTELRHSRSRVQVTMVQMPALNTPQFEWCRTRMPHEPQPVPPIFEPEVAARAIVWAARHRRRELFVGGPTTLAIWGTKLAPRWLDRYLGRTGYASQQTAEPVTQGREDNLWTSPAGDHGARGRFSDRAHRSSATLWWSVNRNWVFGSAAALAAGVLLLQSRRHNAP